MILSSIVYIVLRYLKEVPTCIVTTSFGIVGSTITLGVALGFNFFQLPETALDWGFAIALGLLTFMGQILLTLALCVCQI